MKVESVHNKKYLYAKKLVDRYLIDGLSGMALGLFATLLIGTIIKQVGILVPEDIWIGKFLIQIGQLATVMTGAGIGIGVAHKLGVSQLVLYSSILNGMLGAYATQFLQSTMFMETQVILSGPGDPVGAFVATIVGLEIGQCLSGKTKLDILLTPATTILSGGIVAILIGPKLAILTAVLGRYISEATALQPILMGMVISVSMGIFLTLPISSAAIGVILGLSGIAAGAATAGCCAQMIGFAVMSYSENKTNGLLAQGLGTSMLQMPNIIKNPKVWLPPILTSAITGPIATVIFPLENMPQGAGMGTCGLVGPLLMWQTMVEAGKGNVVTLIQILLVCIILPAILTYMFAIPMRKRSWIKRNDLKLEL